MNVSPPAFAATWEAAEADTAKRKKIEEPSRAKTETRNAACERRESRTPTVAAAAVCRLHLDALGHKYT